jgi:hypothetical protein
VQPSVITTIPGSDKIYITIRSSKRRLSVRNRAGVTLGRETSHTGSRRDLERFQDFVIDRENVTVSFASPETIQTLSHGWKGKTSPDEQSCRDVPKHLTNPSVNCTHAKVNRR